MRARIVLDDGRTLVCEDAEVTVQQRVLAGDGANLDRMLPAGERRLLLSAKRFVVEEPPRTTRPEPRRYRKAAPVLATVAEKAGEVRTPEGVMRYEAGDLLVTDDPPTHCWPVRRDVFGATYREDPDVPTVSLAETMVYWATLVEAEREA